MLELIAFLAFVTFVAVNVLAGYFLACLLKEIHETPCQEGAAIRANAQQPPIVPASANAAAAVAIAAVKSLRAPASDADIDAPGASRRAHEDSPPPVKSDSWSATKTWQDSAVQIQTLKQRLQYARQSSDKGLVKDVAAQIRDCVNVWHGQLTACTENASRPARGNPSAGSADIVRLEMCLAQFETTLSNLESLDWFSTTLAILKNIDRELDALEVTLVRLRRMESDAPQVFATAS